MVKRFILLVAFLVLCFGARPFAQSNPTPAGLALPGYDYSEPNSCTSCHFVYGAKGDHMLEAVGVKFDDNTKIFSFTGNGWFASKHSRSNYRTTQNTYCTKCHSPLQAKPEASYSNGIFKNTVQVPDGKVEGVVCASCHPSSAVAKIIGRRVGIYQIGQDKTKPEAYKVIEEGDEDKLCMNCHKERHSTKNPAFRVMYDIGVRCIDCHMATYGKTNNGQGLVDKRFHDFKVAMNLPFSCGVKNSSGLSCHPEFSVESTLKLIPYLMKQHKKWGDLDSNSEKGSTNLMDAHSLSPRKLKTSKDYYEFWKELEREVEN
jgi:hypothetical protein